MAAKLLKKELRKEMAAILGALENENIQKQSRKLTEIVTKAPWFSTAQRISVFVNTAGEIETAAIIEKCLDDNKQVFIPQFRKGCKTLRMLRLKSMEDFRNLSLALWNIPQPADDVTWDDYYKSGALDLVLMPGVAFTKEGNRLGHGMGFYDRFLADHHERFGRFPLRVALSLQEQIVEQVPLTDTDVPIDILLTDDYSNPQ